MRRFFLPFLNNLLFLSYFLTACANPIPIDKNKLNTTLPPTSEDISHVEEEIEEVKEIENETWDVSDINLSHVDKNRKLIAFSFDDAPSRELENICAVFARFNEEHPDCTASATLFCNGNRLDESAYSSLFTAYALGMELGNHTHTHPDLTKLTSEEILLEIEKTDVLLSRVDKKSKHLFRAPYGKINEEVKSQVCVPIIDWTIDTLDWTGIEENEIYNSVWENRFSGAIVLMHDGYANTVSALKRLLPDLKEDGYQVVNVSTLAKAHRCTLKTGRVYIRARKQYN